MIDIDLKTLVHKYVRFCFDEYEKDPRGWITKNPPSVAEFAEQLLLRDLSFPTYLLFGIGERWLA